MFRFKLKLNMLPVLLALSAYFCLTLVPDASCSPLSDIQNICYKESPKLGKKKIGVNARCLFFTSVFCVCLLVLRMESSGLFFFPLLYTVHIIRSSCLYCFFFNFWGGEVGARSLPALSFDLLFRLSMPQFPHL